MDQSELESELERLSALAESIAVVKRLWVFGSRFKNTHNFSSDLDIAVEVEWVAGQLLGVCEDHFSLWCAALPKFEQSMTNDCPWPIDIQCYAGMENTPCLHEYLQQASTLFYEKT